MIMIRCRFDASVNLRRLGTSVTVVRPDEWRVCVRVFPAQDYCDHMGLLFAHYYPVRGASTVQLLRVPPVGTGTKALPETVPLITDAVQLGGDADRAAHGGRASERGTVLP